MKIADRKTIQEEKGCSLTPGAYVGVAPAEDDGVDFAQRMAEIYRELLSLQAESNVLMDTSPATNQKSIRPLKRIEDHGRLHYQRQLFCGIYEGDG